MKRMLNILAAIFISPEALFGILIFFGFLLFPALYSSLGDNIKNDSELWKYLPGITVALSIYAFKQSSSIRAPLKNSSNKKLFLWPFYQYLVDRVYVCFVFAGIYSISAIAIWVLGSDTDSKIVTLIFLESTVLAATTALTMLLAHQKLIEILESNE